MCVLLTAASALMSSTINAGAEGNTLGDITGDKVIDGRDVRGEKARENAFSMLPAERISQASHVSRTAEGARIILDGQRPIGPVKEPARQRP